jgi:hypothetical protein
MSDLIEWEKHVYTRVGKVEAINLAQRVLDCPEKNLSPLIDIIVQGKPPANVKAAWVYRQLSSMNTDVVADTYDRIIPPLCTLQPDAIKRDLLKVILNAGFDENHAGKLATDCLLFLQSPAMAVAVKYNSMLILDRICKLWPEIEREYHLILAGMMDHETKSFKRQAQKRLLKSRVIEIASIDCKKKRPI